MEFSLLPLAFLGFNFNKEFPNQTNLLLEKTSSELLNKTDPFELQKVSGRKWTKERDFKQLNEVLKDNKLHDLELVRILGEDPFLWHDHWPLRDC